MSKLIGWVGATIGGAMGARVGIMTAFMVSMVGTGAGLYIARRFFSDYLG